MMDRATYRRDCARNTTGQEDFHGDGRSGSVPCLMLWCSNYPQCRLIMNAAIWMDMP